MMKTVDDDIERLPGFYSAREFAEKIGKSRHTVYTWVRFGKLKAYQIAEQIVIPESELGKCDDL